jgi:hypothetical protein
MALSQLDIYFRQILRFSNLFTKSWGKFFLKNWD